MTRTFTNRRYLDALTRHVVVFDGAMGTSLQKLNLTAADFGGEKLWGCNDVLVIAKPEVIEGIHASFLSVGCEVVETDTFRANRISLGVGLAEKEGSRLYITHVFCSPEGYVAKYRKTWLWYAHKGTVDAEIRDEHKWYNPGDGPAPFVLAGVRTTCLICADGNSERAWRQVAETTPQIVFFPNNRHHFRPGWLEVMDRARQIGIPIVATNRVGRSGTGLCDGGAIIVSGQGRILAHCLAPGQEEIVVADVELH